jgi:hypothetical protein
MDEAKKRHIKLLCRKLYRYKKSLAMWERLKIERWIKINSEYDFKKRYELYINYYKNKILEYQIKIYDFRKDQEV